MWKQMRQKLHSASLGRLCRRGVTLSLAVSMLLPSVAYGFDALERPTPMVKDAEEPTIIIEANAVINRWYDPALGDPSDYLTGEFEVAIRVRSGKIGDEAQLFNTLGVALKYDANILTPCRWTSKWDGTYGDTDREMNLSAVGNDDIYEEDCMASMQTLKNNKISTASAHVCETVRVVETGETAGVRDGYVSIRLDSDRPVELKDDKRDGDMFKDEQGTVLGVISFKYDADANKILAKDAAHWLSTNVATVSEGDGDEGSEGGAPALTGRPLIQFAAPEELGNHYSPVELLYYSEKNDMFYSSDETIAPLTGDLVTDEFNRLTLNTETYTEKDVKDHQINFTLVNKTTYNDGGLSLDDLATVLFYDWDDTLIGVLIVPRDGDARKLVNDYVRNNMIHPNLRFERGGTSGGSGNERLVNSMARLNTYRGRHPATGPAEDGAVDSTVVTDGTKYPLTAKIDYAFLKRPMELVERSTTDIGEPVSVWKQLGETEAEWDYLYPYIHGWALIPDDDLADIQYTHPKELWTTIGRGELLDYNGAHNGGYNELNGAPAELTVSGQEFTFADFNFMQKGHSLKPGSVYAVKAVYEPGEDLLVADYNYRMISEPYYNKMNNPAAASGGAYSVNVTFERTNIAPDGTLHGIGRARDLQLRQETTSDLRWENEYLENANISQQAAKTKTTYSTVPVDNVDEVDVQLILSGRHNKVDYYLIEAYGYSFVTGGGRSLTNRNSTGTAHVIDNYNYSTKDNDTDRIYYRAEYVDTDDDGIVNDDRSGSYGFVLMGTLNNLAQKATEYVRGEISELTFYDYLSINTFTDMNLRVNGELIDVMIEDQVYDAWKAAVRAAETAHNGGNNTWWDVEHDCAQFTYHVIQLYVSDYVASGSATLRTPAAADAETITWCDLHEECAASRSGKPTSFAKMVKVALEKTTDDAKDAISLLTLTEAEALSHIRSNKQGTAFGSIGLLADAFIAAVKGINGIRSLNPDALTDDDWDAIQGWILSNPKPTNTTGLAAATKLSKDTAWWNEGESAPGASNLKNLLDATQKTIDKGRDAWINFYRYQDAFTDMKTNGVSPACQWTRITENLVKDIDGNAFDDYDQFRTAIKAAVTAMGTDRTWNEYQYYLIHNADPSSDPNAATEYPKYWWHNGYSKVNSLPTMFVAAQQALAGDDTVWKMFSLTDLYDPALTDLHFRSGFNGTTDVYTAADFATFKAAVLAFVQEPGAIIATGSSNLTDSWNQLQYYLIHPGCQLNDRNTTTAYRAEADYYWWRDNGAGTAYAISGGSMDANVATLTEAAYRSAINGNPHALDNLTAAAAAAFRLIPSYAGTEETWDALTKYDDTTLPNLKAQLDALMLAAGAANCRGLSWRQIQHYLLTGAYLLESDPTLPSDKKTDENGYWWREGNDKPGGSVVIKSDLDKFLEEIDKYIRGEITEDDLGGESNSNSVVEQYILNDKLGLFGGTERSPKAMSGTTKAQKTRMREKIRYLATTIRDSGATTCVGILDWYVLQYYAIHANLYALGDPIKDQASALLYYTNTLNGTWVPDEYAVASISLEEFAMFALMAPPMAPPMDTLVETDPETGVATVTTVVETDLENGLYLTVETVTTVDFATNTAVTTTITTLTDGDGNVLSTSEAVTETVLPNTVKPDPVEPDDPGRLEDAASGVEPDDPGERTDSSVEPDTAEPGSVGLDDLGEPNNTDPVEPDDPGEPTNTDPVEPGSVGLDDLGEPTNTDPVKADTVEPDPVEPDDPGRLSDTPVGLDDLGEPTNTTGIGVSMVSAPENIIGETAVRNIWLGYLVMPSTIGESSRLSVPLTTKLVKRLTSGEKRQLMTIESTNVYNNAHRLISRAGPPLRSPILSRISFDFIDLANERRMAV